ncbi:hypothetical protein AXF42_Ash011837 [Apostasia shenzhenica]|uniref:Uncharacterized protein n=1 Tax=Apostasia shenzhenica TaxID=1088818 RepID=A0A2I0AVZ2_9ASPA|nr:hypothetical protein AXF42_Ash011837 [Apostasia shenzhenica]
MSNPSFPPRRISRMSDLRRSACHERASHIATCGLHCACPCHAGPSACAPLFPRLSPCAAISSVASLGGNSSHADTWIALPQVDPPLPHVASPGLGRSLSWAFWASGPLCGPGLPTAQFAVGLGHFLFSFQPFPSYSSLGGP